MQREEILAEIRRTAAENGGKPLGKARFEAITGLRPYDWQKFWPRISDAQKEAGFEPNNLVTAYNDSFLFDKVIELARELKRFPIGLEMRIQKRKDPTFPNDKVYERFGKKAEFVQRVLEYCVGKTEYADMVEMLEPLAKPLPTKHMTSIENRSYGFVYLVKGHPGEYKIGRTNLVDRRLSELGATASIEQSLIHEIKTDDPAGIEAYWHKRFQNKRMRGEWFRLNSADVQAFKWWRKIY